VKRTLFVNSGHIAHYTVENTTTYSFRINTGKVYAISILPVTFV
jgi:hypothetical protein